MSGTILHMCLSVRGALNWPRRKLKGMFRDIATGRPCSADQAREFLLDELSQGHEVIPLGSPCEGFDYRNGCPGHPQAEPRHA